jgi:hypothetical protein
MTTNLTEFARGAPKAAMGTRPVTTWREDLITMALSAWPILALMFDGRNHNNEVGQESFFSLAHVILYGGMTLTALWVGVVVTRYQLAAGTDWRKLLPDLKAIPVGYGVAIIGFIILGIGGPADFIWHAVYGFEVGVDAIYSPPHLALFLGGLLLSSTGIRAMWAKRDIAPGLGRFLPVILSAGLFIAMAHFVTMYLSPFMHNVAPTSDFANDVAQNFNDVKEDQSISLNDGLSGYGDDLYSYEYFSLGQSAAGMVISTLILLGTSLLMMRRWRVPFGAFTATFTMFSLYFNVITSYDDVVVIMIPLVLCGLTLDLLQQRLARGPGERLTLGGIRSTGPIAAFMLWGSYYLLVAIRDGIGWTEAVTAGVIVVGTLAGFGAAFLVAPPEYGPRLVEGEDTTDEA